MTQASPPEGPGYRHNGPPAPAAAPPGQAPVLTEHEPPTDLTGPPTGPITLDPATTEPQTKVRRSRFGGLWVGLIVAAVVLVLLLVFILQNSQTVQVEYFGFSGHLPLAVAILLGVAAGALLVALPGTVRILQLRKKVRHH